MKKHKMHKQTNMLHIHAQELEEQKINSNWKKKSTDKEMHTFEVATFRLWEPLLAEELEGLAETPNRLLTLPLPDNFCRKNNIWTCEKIIPKEATNFFFWKH